MNLIHDFPYEHIHVHFLFIIFKKKNKYNYMVIPFNKSNRHVPSIISCICCMFVTTFKTFHYKYRFISFKATTTSSWEFYSASLSCIYVTAIQVMILTYILNYLVINPTKLFCYSYKIL